MAAGTFTQVDSRPRLVSRDRLVARDSEVFLAVRSHPLEMTS